MLFPPFFCSLISLASLPNHSYFTLRKENLIGPNWVYMAIPKTTESICRPDPNTKYMSASDLLFKTIHPLPEVAKLQLLEYVEYLRFKFGMEEDQAEKTEYDQLLLQLLEQRLQQAKDAPNSLLSPEAFQQRITQKHNWDEPEL